MDNKLFVGNLSFNTADGELRRHFETAGEVVSAEVVLERDTRRSRGFGFVEMATAAAASEARTQLDGSSLGGRELRVNLAEDKTARPAASQGLYGDVRRSGSRRY